MFLSSYPQFLKDPDHPKKGGLDHLGRGVIHIADIDLAIRFIGDYIQNRDVAFKYTTVINGSGENRVGAGHQRIFNLLSIIRGVMIAELNMSTHLIIKATNPFDPSICMSLTYKYVDDVRMYRIECRTLGSEDPTTDDYLIKYDITKVKGRLATFLKHREHALSKIKKQLIRAGMIDDWIGDPTVLKELHRTHQNKYDEIELPRGHHGDPLSTLLYCNRKIAEIWPHMFKTVWFNQIEPMVINFPKLRKVRGRNVGI